MEVHHHAHTARKKWTHYFWEFLMLFLAVFCGFLAENIREHTVEHQRAKELAKTLYKETVADSISIQQKIASRGTKEQESVYFINYVKDSSLTTLSPRFFPAFSWTFIQTQRIMFEPGDGILNQLRNSGELRYFKNNELQAKIGKLNVAIADLRARNEREYSFVEMYLRTFSIKHFDFTWYENFTDHGKTDLAEALVQKKQIDYVGKITNLDKFNRQEAQNTASYYLLMLRGTRIGQYSNYVKINHELLEILREEYHFE